MALVEFTDDQFSDLRDVDGILLEDCKGQRVAIGHGFDYSDVWEFLVAYINEYGIDGLADVFHIEDSSMFFESLCEHVYDEDTMDALVMKYFEGNYADAIEDEFPEYSYREAKLEAEDQACDRAMGK